MQSAIQNTGKQSSNQLILSTYTSQNNSIVLNSFNIHRMELQKRLPWLAIVEKEEKIAETVSQVTIETAPSVQA